MLFAVPFIAVGAGMGGCAGWTAVKVRDSQHWTEVPAIIKSAKLKRGDTLRALATYEYDVNGRKYSGNRVSFHRGSDNVSSFQRTAFNELDKHRKSGRPFRAFVNPQDPAESVLYRNVRWEMMLLYCGVAVLFGGTGVGLFVASLVAWRRPSARPVTAISPRSHGSRGLIGPRVVSYLQMQPALRCRPAPRSRFGACWPRSQFWQRGL